MVSDYGSEIPVLLTRKSNLKRLSDSYQTTTHCSRKRAPHSSFSVSRFSKIQHEIMYVVPKTTFLELDSQKLIAAPMALN